MINQDFDSMNPYQSMVAITADSPDDLVRILRSNLQPIKILAITSYGTRQVAYITGDVRIKNESQPPKIKKGK